MNDPRPITERDRLEAEIALIWSELEPLIRAHDALVNKLTELNEKEAAA